MRNKKTIGDVIRELRQNKNISQRELANILGVSNTAIYKIENNKNKYFDPEMLSKIAKALDTTSDEIMRQVNESNNVENQNTSSDYKDIPIEHIEKFLEGRKMLAFKGQVLTEEQLRYVYAFLATADEMYKKQQKKLAKDPEYRKDFE
ncbi:helix-turn-helix domain-containing protein [Thermoanaerobacterium thermosaccharolyticum]|uniref:Putative transcriptional regulator n=1 Tax=Thermoanaerobacterium thermosaccharolyticum M0795 TaxID=698948 RepID=L0IGA0_THETR|nr:helix-turn-helix transcriptional regulator [Thermoanaerobacterium thermosaccharolyticum]AGB18570.1 putative transcriptional regulator [Thermoanaerobacterium thermosaccharolyticum M0795]